MEVIRIGMQKVCSLSEEYKRVFRSIYISDRKQVSECF